MNMLGWAYIITVLIRCIMPSHIAVRRHFHLASVYNGRVKREHERVLRKNCHRSVTKWWIQANIFRYLGTAESMQGDWETNKT